MKNLIKIKKIQKVSYFFFFVFIQTQMNSNNLSILQTLISSAYDIVDEHEYRSFCEENFDKFFFKLATQWRPSASATSCVFVEGNIAAGKSTLLSKLPIKVVQEPIQLWQSASCGSQNNLSLFEMYNKKLPRVVFLFQIFALATRHMQLVTEMSLLEDGCSIVAERSIFSDRLFFQINHEGCSEHEITSI